jgi:hypothetical protein
MKRAKRSSLTGARWLLAARETGAGRAVLGRSILERVGATGAGGGSEALLRILPLGEGAAVLTGRGVRGGGLRGGGLRGVRLRGGRVDAAAGSGLGLGGLGLGSLAGECPAIGGECGGPAARWPYTSCPATILAGTGSAAGRPQRHSRNA